MKLKLVKVNHLWDILVWYRFGRDRLSNRVAKMREVNSSGNRIISPFGFIVIGFHNKKVEQQVC